MEQEEKEVQVEVVDRDQYLRLAADFENYKRRVNLEREEIKKQTKVQSLEIVFQAIDDLKIAQSYGESGIDLVLNKLKSSLEREGITEMDLSAYNPDWMEVISLGAGPSGQVLQVVKTGYLYQGVPCRWAQVILGAD